MASNDGPSGPPVLSLSDVDVYRSGQPVLIGINWEVREGQRWAVLGPNGSGKTTLVQLASGYLHPARGRVEILGQRLGRVDVRSLRQQVAVVSASVARMVHPRLSALEVVVPAGRGALEPWWHDYEPTEWQQARALLTAAGFGHIAERPFGQLSEGERQQVLLARALMCSARLVLLDEPCAGLDMGGRERLLGRLAALTELASAPPAVMVTHHVEEIPVGFTHVLLLRQGSVLASGEVEGTLTAEHLSECFGLPLTLGHHDGRWHSRMAGSTPVPPTSSGGVLPTAGERA
jgi:iron complex transport system ATP-binding protein